MVERYEAAAGDPELLALRDDIAVMETRIAELLARVDSGEASAAWRSLESAWGAVERARRDPAALAGALAELGAIIRRGVSDYAAWDDVQRAMDAKRKLTEAEQKRLVAMRQMVTAEEAMVFVAAVQSSVRRHVTDQGALRAIADDVARIVKGEATT
jgi:hypothetical protein